MTKIDIHSDYGEIKLGPLRVHWCNATQEDPGFCLLGWKHQNIEMGQIDQDRPGIYLTRYVNGDVEHLRTIAQF